MPIITVELMEGRTVEQKRELAEVITREVCRIAKTVPDNVSIVFRDMPRTNYARAGKLHIDR